MRITVEIHIPTCWQLNKFLGPFDISTRKKHNLISKTRQNQTIMEKDITFALIFIEAISIYGQRLYILAFDFITVFWWSTRFWPWMKKKDVHPFDKPCKLLDVHILPRMYSININKNDGKISFVLALVTDHLRQNLNACFSHFLSLVFTVRFFVLQRRTWCHALQRHTKTIYIRTICGHCTLLC